MISEKVGKELAINSCRGNLTLSGTIPLEHLGVIPYNCGISKVLQRHLIPV